MNLSAAASPGWHALDWALVHFTWQGTVVALVLRTALIALRRQSAQIRYRVSGMALAILVLLPVMTFYFGFGAAQERPRDDAGRLIISDSALEHSAAASESPARGGPSGRQPTRIDFALEGWIEGKLSWISLGWLLGVLLLSLRLLVAWTRVRWLAHHGTPLIEELWPERLRNLCRRLEVARPVVLLRSNWVEVPTVVGWLRPVILLPCCCLSGLTPGQLEAVLAHELAHIRRHDYAINLLQAVAETLLFYHPAVWWVSQQVRQEREHGCDDMVVSVCGNPVEYAHALASLEARRGRTDEFALAANGGPLLNRVRRLLGLPVERSRFSGWAVSGALVLLVVLGFVVERSHVRAAPPAQASSWQDSIEGTLPSAANETRQAPQATASEKQVKITSQWFEIKGKGPVQLDWLFGRSSAEIEPEPEPAVPKGDLPGANLPYAANIRVSWKKAADGVVRLSEAQARALIEFLTQETDVDVLKTPALITKSGREGRIEVTELKTVVVDVKMNKDQSGQASANYKTELVPLGPSLKVIPVSKNQDWELLLSGSLTEFLGYRDAGVEKAAESQLQAKKPEPLFRVRDVSATGQVKSGESLLLRMPATEETVRSKKGFFRRLEETKLTRRLYLLIKVEDMP
jgi:beta-lactamase regulating signal transducer with metallopeptidase domain